VNSSNAGGSGPDVCRAHSTYMRLRSRVLGEARRQRVLDTILVAKRPAEMTRICVLMQTANLNQRLARRHCRMGQPAGR
jgi:hypothetical protein